MKTITDNTARSDIVATNTPAKKVVYTPEFRSCVESEAQYNLILAGAGCGKTTALTHKIVHIMQSKPDSRILAVTFTNNAAETMRERLALMLDNSALDHVTVCTIHSLGCKLLQRYYPACGRQQGYKILTPYVMNNFLQLVSTDEYDVKDLKKNLSKWKNHLLEPDHHQKQLLAKYELLLIKHNLVDFDDLILLPLQMMHKNPPIANFEARRYSHVFIDEYQDTSPEQVKFLDHLLHKDTILTCVGDDAQSIYAFRGADPSCVSDFETKYLGAKVFTLSKNYRSTENICDIGNKTLLGNPMKYRKTLYAASKQQGGDISFIHEPDVGKEAEAIAEAIAKIREKNPEDGIAIIYRMHKVGKVISRELARKHIPSKLVGISITDSSLVATYMYILAAILHSIPDQYGQSLSGKPVVAGSKSSSQALIFLVISVIKNVDAKTAEALLEYSNDHKIPVFEVVRNAGMVPGIISSRVHALGQFAYELSGLHQHIVTRGFDGRLHDKIVSMLKSRLDKIVNTSDSEEVAAEFIIVNETFAFLENNPSFADVCDVTEKFLTEHVVDTKNDSEDDEVNAVQLSTIHHVKGAEFDHVFVAAVTDRILPMCFTSLEEKPIGEIMEERRLFHVAVTRGKKSVTISSSGKRSVFLDEMDIITEPAEKTGSVGMIAIKIPKQNNYYKNKYAKYHKKSGSK